MVEESSLSIIEIFEVPVLYQLLLLLLTMNIAGAYQLSVCAIFKNEAPHLTEWIEFHKLQGVEHFYLYNNNSCDAFEEVLSPYIASDEVTLVDWPYTYGPQTQKEGGNPWLKVQSGAYTDCLERYGATTRWLAFIDCDEFLFCPGGEMLPEFLKAYNDYGGLCVNWLIFGTANIDQIPDDKLMIEMLTRCAFRSEFRNTCVKSIVQPQYTRKARNAHTFIYKRGYYGVTALKEKVTNSLRSPNPTFDRIRINHYWTRTEEHFFNKKIASRNGRRSFETKELLKSWKRRYNRCTDMDIVQFVPALRQRLGLDG